MVRFQSPELSSIAKLSPKQSRTNPVVFGPNNVKCRVFLENKWVSIPCPLRKFSSFTIQKAGPHMGRGHLSLLSRHAFWCTGRRKGKLRLVLFVWELHTDRSNLNFPFLRPVNPNDPRGRVFGAVLGGSKLTNLQSIFEKTRVGFGSPELSLRLSGTGFCALSSGHGPRGLGFHGGPSGRIFVFLGGQQWKKHMRMQDEIG